MKTDFAYPLVAVREAAATVLGLDNGPQHVAHRLRNRLLDRPWRDHRRPYDGGGDRLAADRVGLRPRVLILLTSAALTWYLPIYFESLPISLSALAWNFFLWIVILAAEVELAPMANSGTRNQGC